MAPVSPGTALPKPRLVLAGRACQRLRATSPSTILQQRTCQALGHTWRGGRHRREGGDRTKHHEGAMVRVFQCRRHGTARSQQFLAGRVPQDGATARSEGPLGQSPATTITPHPPTCKHCPRQPGKTGGETEAQVWRPGSGRGVMPSTGQPRLPLTQPDVEGRC